MTTNMTGRAGRLAIVRPAGAGRLRPADSQRAAGSPKADILDLILAHHRRIRRLADVLEAAAPRGSADGGARVAGLMWSRLAELLEVCAEAEREICFPPLFSASHDSDLQWLEALADQADIRAAVQEAALQPAGSPAWWRAVSAATRFTRTHLDTVELRLLAPFARDVTPERRRLLGEQWVRLTAALRRDRSGIASDENGAFNAVRD